MLKRKNTINCEKQRKVNGSGSDDLVHLQLPNNSSSSNGSTEPLTPPTTPLQPQQVNHQSHSNTGYRLGSSHSSSTSLIHSAYSTASSVSHAAHTLLPSSNSPSTLPQVPQSIEEPIRSSRLAHCQDPHLIPDYYNCSGGGSYWDGRTSSLSVISGLATSIPEMNKGFITNLSSPCDNQLVQIGSPQCKGTPSPPHTSPASIVGEHCFSEKTHLESSDFHQHLVTEANFDGISTNQDPHSSNYSPHAQYGPHYQYFNSYYNQGNGGYPHSGYSQHNYHHLQHSPDSVPSHLHHLHRKMNSNSTSPGSSVSTVPSLSPSSGTIGSTTIIASKNKSSENGNSAAMMSSSTITSNRMNGHKGNEESSWAM